MLRPYKILPGICKIIGMRNDEWTGKNEKQLFCYLEPGLREFSTFAQNLKPVLHETDTIAILCRLPCRTIELLSHQLLTPFKITNTHFWTQLFTYETN